MKGFFLIEYVIAQLIMSFILCVVLFISLKLYEDSVDFHYTILAKIINLSVKQANVVGVSYDALQYASSVLPNASVTLDKSSVTSCWQIAEKQCETL